VWPVGTRGLNKKSLSIFKTIEYFSESKILRDRLWILDLGKSRNAFASHVWKGDIKLCPATLNKGAGFCFFFERHGLIKKKI